MLALKGEIESSLLTLELANQQLTKQGWGATFLSK